ncbi:MAG: ATP-dependent DNA helicase [bacterium]|nr:ATP-dependent DNA helicase [bacterium]
MKSDFLKLYKQLNAKQKEAVDAIEGPVIVIAGPGTGKTHLLSMRIANILDKTDASPESILALTFTESGAAAMRKKLSRIIGSAAYGVEISTFHGFCNKVIKENPDEFEEIIGANNITDVEQIEIIKEIIDKSALKYLKPFGDNYFYLKPIINSINELKRQGIEPADFLVLAEKKEKKFLTVEDLYYESGRYNGQMKGKYLKEQKYINRNKDLSLIYDKYQQRMKSQKFYDYGDMIMRVAKKLEQNKNLLLILQEQYQYILVDEHQDTNSAQNEILELLAGYYDNPNLFIVGDEKQAIYRFQGASIENFHYFKNLYKNVRVIALKNNYRSTQTILNAAKTALTAKARHQEAPVVIRSYKEADRELYFLAKDIQKHLGEETAVLYRENKEAGPIARILEKNGIPFVIESDQNVMDDEDIRKLFVILKTVQKFGSPQEFIEMLHLDFLNVPALEIYEIAKDPYGLAKIGKTSNLISKIYRDVSEWRKSSLNESAAGTFENIVRESGFLDYLLSKPSAQEKIKKLRALFTRLKNLVATHKNYTLNQFFSYLDTLQEQNVFVKSEVVPVPGKVRLMTAHKSKGLEFDRVYIVNCSENQWGFKRGRDFIKLPEEVIGKEEDDIQNLFYVALTRARKNLIISYSERNREGKEQLPAGYLQEIEEKYVQAETEAEDFDEIGRIEFAPTPCLSSTTKEKTLLNELFFKYGLSATALNNYLECPWKYFYRNLIRIPEAPNKHLMFGTAVHSAFKYFFDKWMKGERLSQIHFISAFEESLRSQPLQEREYLETLEKGRIALAGYYGNYCGTWKNNIFSEFKIRGVQLSDNVVVNGKIDKIEILDASNAVHVADYKTGKPKKNPDYYRQLVFYKLLLDNHQNGKFHMVSGEIDFVEPDEKGRYKKELFEITKAEADELKEKIISVSNEIINLDFWDKRCADPECRYCSMRKSMA